MCSCTVFPLTLAHSPMASRHCQQASHFLKYATSLVNDILWKDRKNGKIKIHFPQNHKIWVRNFQSGQVDFTVTHPDG